MVGYCPLFTAKSTTMTRELQQLIDNAMVWRGCQARFADRGWPSGQAILDQTLADGGWPRSAVIEVKSQDIGLGELRLLLPLLRQVSQQRSWMTWITPPALPNPHALARAGVALDRLLLIDQVNRDEALWASEQCLRSGHSAVVLLWQQGIAPSQWRRLQLAAEAGNSSGFVFQPTGPLARHAALSISLAPAEEGLLLTINRGRGHLKQQQLQIAIDDCAEVPRSMAL